MCLLGLISYGHSSPLSLGYQEYEVENNNDQSLSSKVFTYTDNKPSLLRHKRDRESDMKNFQWSFSVESPSIEVDQPRFQNYPSTRQQNIPEVSVQFFNGFESLGAPGEHTSRLQLEAAQQEREGSEAVHGGGGGSSAIASKKACCGPYYPFRSCCQT